MAAPAARRARAARPKLAVWKFASCDGCQLSLLDCEDELLALAGAVEIANFPEASRAVTRGPYDLSLVEGSITTPHDAERIHAVRRQSKVLVTIGACATSGGLQALRNYADLHEMVPAVYASPEWIHALALSTPIAQHVRVDYELHGCPVSKRQLLQVVQAFLAGRKPQIPAHCVCVDCKRRGNVCVMVAAGRACMGPVTRSGCDALCPSWTRGCYGCFGPIREPNTDSLSAILRAQGLGEADLVRAYRTMNAADPALRRASEAHEARSRGRGEDP